MEDPDTSNQAQTTQEAVTYAAFDEKENSVARDWLVLGFVGLLITLSSFISAPLLQNHAALGAGIVALSIFGGIITSFAGFVMYSIALGKAKQSTLQKFISDNGWQYATGGSLDDVATSLLSIGHDQKVQYQFSGNYKGKPFTAVQYTTTTGSGRDQTMFQAVNLHILLAQEYPLVFLENTSKNDFWTVGGVMPERIEGGKALQVEGDFNKYYKVTIVPGTEETVLEWLTPDLMSELTIGQGGADIEIEASKLFIISPRGLIDKEILQRLFATADIILKHISELSDSWQASSAPDSVQQMAATSLAPRQRALKGFTTPKIFTVVIVLIWFLVGPLGHFIHSAVIEGILVILFGVIAVFAAHLDQYR